MLMLETVKQLGKCCAGSWKSKVVCSSCKTQSSQQVESFSCLSIGIPEASPELRPSSSTLSECLQQNFKEEVVGDDWSCKACGSRLAVKSTHMEVWPRILLLHLKRFTPTLYGYQKIQSLIDVVDTFEVEGVQYRVLAKVNHVGSSMNSGHYTADILLGKWKRCDDRTITDCTRQDPSREVYLIFSEKI